MPRKSPVFLLVLALGCPAWLAATTYYLDCSGGDDAASGTSPATGWRSLDRLNSAVFQSGDRILLRAGCQWTGVLAPKGSGAEGQPIILDRYAEGAKPLIRGEGAVPAVLLENVEYWEVSNLEVTNDAPDEGLRRGVLVVADGSRSVVRHIHLRGLHVHHVRGKLGAEMAEKATGGIGVELRGKNAAARFDDLLVQDCTVEHVDSTGIYTWSEAMPHPRDRRWKDLHWTNVRIRGNRLSDIGKNAIIIRAALEPVIERNVVVNAAARLHGNAIFVFGCDNALMQFNEVSGTRYHGLEGAAFDSDYNSEGTVIQFNYSHNNGGGLVNVCSNPAAGAGRGYNDGTIVRFNVSQNEGSRVIAFDGPATNTRIYHNTIYVGPGTAPNIVEFDTFGKTAGYADGAWFANNIIHNAGRGRYAWGLATNVSFQANCYSGNRVENEPADEKKILADAMFEAAGGGPPGYRLKPGSLCAGSGVPVAGGSIRDYFGALVRVGRPDRGAVQGAPAAELRTGIVYSSVEGVDLRADLYLPQGPGPFPAAVYIHGGGWSGGSRTQLQRQAAHMAALGMAGMCIEYRLAPRWKYPAPLEDSRAALRWLRANAGKYRINPARIAAVGSSSGGHLASLLGVTGSAGERAAVVVALNPVLDLTDMAHRESMVSRFLGRRCEDALGVCREASPVSHVGETSAPFLILHGTADESVPYRQAEDMVRRLRSAGVEVELFTAPGAPHTFYAGSKWFEQTLKVIEGFLRAHLPAQSRRSKPVSRMD